MIRVENVSFTYENADNGAAILNNSIQISKGEIVLLCGESGSGKTTFIRLLNGLIPNYYEGTLTGKVQVKDKNPEKVELYELATYVGSVFQNPKAQFYTLITDTEIVFACENMGMDRDEILSRFDTTVDAMHLESLIGRNLFTLSGGEKQKIACASVYALQPDVLVLDEPTSNLDIKTIRELENILRLWKVQGKTIIIAEHRLDWLNLLADRVLYFKDGEIKQEFTGTTFFEKTLDDLHKMGLRGINHFVPQCIRKSRAKEGLELRDFCFTVKKKELLHVENLILPKGSVIAILGDNGAGKTTLARCLCGLEEKVCGTFTFLGKEYKSKQRLKLCYMVMQDVNHQLFTESVLDEVILGIKDITEEEKIEYAKKILSVLDLLVYKDRHPMSLSGGQKQRVAISGAIASHKEIIVYDEPTSGLDYRHMKEVSACIKKLSEMGKTQMIITHDPELVANCCDYLVFMNNGTVSRFGEWTDENIEFVSYYFEKWCKCSNRFND